MKKKDIQYDDFPTLTIPNQHPSVNSNNSNLEPLTVEPPVAEAQPEQTSQSEQQINSNVE